MPIEEKSAIKILCPCGKPIGGDTALRLHRKVCDIAQNIEGTYTQYYNANKHKDTPIATVLKNRAKGREKCSPQITGALPPITN